MHSSSLQPKRLWPVWFIHHGHSWQKWLLLYPQGSPNPWNGFLMLPQYPNSLQGWWNGIFQELCEGYFKLKINQATAQLRIFMNIHSNCSGHYSCHTSDISPQSCNQGTEQRISSECRLALCEMDMVHALSCMLHRSPSPLIHNCHGSTFRWERTRNWPDWAGRKRPTETVHWTLMVEHGWLPTRW